jgi:hypothetical protein
LFEEPDTVFFFVCFHRKDSQVIVVRSRYSDIPTPETYLSDQY